MQKNACLELIKIDLEEDLNFSLLSFEGLAELNNTYEFKLELEVDSVESMEHLLGSRVIWQWNESGRWGGIVKSLSSFNKSNELQHLILIIIPEYAQLKSSKKKRIFKNKNLLEVIDTVFSEHKLSKPDIKNLCQEYPLKDHWIQYDESDFNFIRRVLGENDLSYCFSESRMVLLEREKYLVTSLNLNSVIQYQLKQGKNELVLSLTSRQFLNPGDRFSFNHMDFIVSEVKYYILEPKNQSETKARIYCEVIAKDKIKPVIYPPFVNGYQKGDIIEILDKVGSIKFNMRFDWDKNPLSFEMPSAQAWISQKQGLQFLPEVGDSVALLFSDVNPNNAFIAGVLGSNEYEAPFSMIKTKQHQIFFDETEGKQEFRIETLGEMVVDLGLDFRATIHANEQLEIKNEHLIDLKQGRYLLNASSIRLKVGSSEIQVDHSGIQLKSAQIEFQTENGVNRGLARYGDAHQCPLLNPDSSPHWGGGIQEGSNNVIINGLKAARVRDNAHCNGPSDVLLEGVEDLLINGQAAAFQGAQSLHGGVIQTASSNVISTGMNNKSSSDLTKKASQKLAETWVQVSVLFPL